jgi:hypothetical protein
MLVEERMGMFGFIIFNNNISISCMKLREKDNGRRFRLGLADVDISEVDLGVDQ